MRKVPAQPRFYDGISVVSHRGFLRPPGSSPAYASCNAGISAILGGSPAYASCNAGISAILGGSPAFAPCIAGISAILGSSPAFAPGDAGISATYPPGLASPGWYAANEY